MVDWAQVRLVVAAGVRPLTSGTPLVGVGVMAGRSGELTLCAF